MRAKVGARQYRGVRSLRDQHGQAISEGLYVAGGLLVEEVTVVPDC